MKISAIVLTKNEERNIERCLKSLLFCDQIIIIDDYSDDKTIDKIKSLINKNKKIDIKIIKRRLNNNFADQKNFAIKQTRYQWILSIDADEELTQELKDEIKILFDNPDKLVDGYYLKRRDFFWNKEMKYGEIFKARKKGFIRLFKKEVCVFQGLVHEELKIKNSNFKISQLKNFINHYPHQTLKEFINKVNYYSSLRALELKLKNKKANIFQIIYYPFLKFFYTYFILLGFLDGVEGFVYSFLMSFYSFLTRGKLYLENKKI